MKNLTDFRKTVETGVDPCLRATSLFNSFCSNVAKTKLHVFVVRFTVDCKTVGFFLKISKEIGEAWRKSLTHANRASLASFHSFCLTACSRAGVLEYAKIRAVLQSSFTEVLCNCFLLMTL